MGERLPKWSSTAARVIWGAPYWMLALPEQRRGGTLVHSVVALCTTAQFHILWHLCQCLIWCFCSSSANSHRGDSMHSMLWPLIYLVIDPGHSGSNKATSVFLAILILQKKDVATCLGWSLGVCKYSKFWILDSNSCFWFARQFCYLNYTPVLNFPKFDAQVHKLVSVGHIAPLPPSALLQMCPCSSLVVRACHYVWGRACYCDRVLKL